MRSRRIYWFWLVTLYFVITSIRSIHSIVNLPPDPGLGFQISAQTEGLLSLFESNNGYLQIAPSLISEVLNLVPLSQLTYWSTFINALISAICAVVVTKALLDVTTMSNAVIVGALFSMSFAAHEGLIGNVWAVRWILLFATCVVASIPTFASTYWRSTLLLFIVTGLSHAYAFIPAVAFLGSAAARRDFRGKSLAIGLSLLGASLFQLFIFLTASTQLQLYGDKTLYLPWSGAGVFWWAIFVFPLGFGLVALVLNLDKKPLSSWVSSPKSNLAIQAISMAVLSYFQLGIKSSPAVTTANLSFAAVMVAIHHQRPFSTTSAFKSLAVIICVVSISIVSIRYFFPSYFLTSAEGWPTEVKRAADQCNNSDLESIDLTVFEFGDAYQSEQLSCTELINWNKWFFQR